MSVSFNMTRTEIAQRVLGKVTKIGSTTALSVDTATVYQALDLRLKSMHELGIFWRKVTTVPVTFSLTAGVASASGGNGDVLFPIKCTWTNGSLDEPVDIVGMREYAGIVDKGRTGNPIKVLWKGGSEFVFYPVPSASGTAKLLYEKVADDTSDGGTVDVDVAMIRPLMDLVKYDVADDYGVPEGTIGRWAGEAKLAERSIRKLGAQHVDLAPVAVDDFDNRQPGSRVPSDYNRY